MQPRRCRGLYLAALDRGPGYDGMPQAIHPMLDPPRAQIRDLIRRPRVAGEGYEVGASQEHCLQPYKQRRRRRTARGVPRRRDTPAMRPRTLARTPRRRLAMPATLAGT